MKSMITLAFASGLLLASFGAFSVDPVEFAGYEWMCVKANECNESREVEVSGYLWECRDDRCWTTEKREEIEVATFLWSDSKSPWPWVS